MAHTGCRCSSASHVSGIGGSMDGRVVTMFPADSNGAKLTYGSGTPIDRWICDGTGTTVAAGSLPSRCRGN